MSDRTLRIVMNGVTGRMGYRQHLVRSILAIRDDGGFELPDGSRLQVEPILVGRNHDKLAELAGRHGHRGVHHRPRRRAGRRDRPGLLRRADHRRAQEGDPQGDRRGKHIYTEKPIAESVEEGLELAEAGAAAGSSTAWCTTSSTCPG